MKPVSKSDKAGFTLIEVMVSIIILMVGMLGLLEALGLASHQVARNGLRSEAVKLAENQMIAMKIKPYGMIFSSYTVVPIKFRGASVKYYVNRSSAEISRNISKELTVRVDWKYKSMSNFHEVRSIRTFNDSKDNL